MPLLGCPLSPSSIPCGAWVLCSSSSSIMASSVCLLPPASFVLHRYRSGLERLRHLSPVITSVSDSPCSVLLCWLDSAAAAASILCFSSSIIAIVNGATCRPPKIDTVQYLQGTLNFLFNSYYCCSCLLAISKSKCYQFASKIVVVVLHQ